MWWAGSTRSFRGPGAFSVTAPPTPLAFIDGRQVRIQTGVVRAPLPEPGIDPTDIWELDSRQPGTLCVRAGATPLLWRPAAPGSQRLTIRSLAGTSTAGTWAAGETHLAWPTAIPVTDGGIYTLVRGARSVRITLRVVPTVAEADIDTLSAALLARNCQAQLATLIATHAASPDPVAKDAPAGQR